MMLEIVINSFFFIALLAGVSYPFLLVLIAVYEFRLTRKREVVHPYSGISILKPMKGLEDQLRDNLRSFFVLDYPKYEILFGVASPEDPSIPIIKDLQQEYPDVSSQLIINANQIGLNPKINNLHNIYQHAQYDYLLISDSNIRVTPDYLKDLLHCLRIPGTGLVTSTIRGISGRRIGSLLDNLHLNTFIAPTVFLIKKIIRLPISIGKSMFFQRDTLNKLGGFQTFKNVLAEDHLLGEAIRKLGFEVRISSKPVNSVNESWPLQNYLDRHLRWAKLRRNLNAFYYFLELFSNPISVGLIYAIISPKPENWFLWGFLVLYKMMADYLINLIIQSDLCWYHFFLVPLKDFLNLGIWFLPYLDRKVFWRGTQFEIGKDTVLIPLTGE